MPTCRSWRRISSTVRTRNVAPAIVQNRSESRFAGADVDVVGSTLATRLLEQAASKIGAMAVDVPVGTV
jgi:hypothetical protein